MSDSQSGVQEVMNCHHRFWELSSGPLSLISHLSLSGPIRHILTSARSPSPAQCHLVGWGYCLFFFCPQDFSSVWDFEKR